MSTKETVVSTASAAGSKTDPTAVPPAIPYTDSAQERLLELRQMRGLIPHLVIPASPRDRSRLSAGASVPRELVELTTVAVTNEKSLVRGESIPPAEIRDLTAYADAYDPFADELEAFALFVRHSVNAARHQAGLEALTTYALAQRLAKQPATAHLAPYVADMRRALGRFRKLKAEEREARKAARAAARAASQQP
jgi:hypothetical protein